MHSYLEGGHGYGMGYDKPTAKEWPSACREWLKVKGLAR